jgi:putative component of toxin-antitoxin plasmid stabilization module
MILDKRAIRKIVGPKREEVGEGWRKFCNEGRHDVLLTWCFYDNKNKEDEIGRACGMHRQEKKCLQDLGERILREDTV